MTIDQALLEMELVGHDFFAYHDSQCGKFSVVYRRRGYDYGVIRLVDSEQLVSALTVTSSEGTNLRRLPAEAAANLAADRAPRWQAATAPAAT